jgi:hypothetical protein
VDDIVVVAIMKTLEFVFIYLTDCSKGGTAGRKMTKAMRAMNRISVSRQNNLNVLQQPMTSEVTGEESIASVDTAILVV